MISASTLYSFIQCPHRVWLDAKGNQSERDEISPFVRLLWERGTTFERETMDRLDADFLDLSDYPAAEKVSRTLEAMRSGVALIYSGRIESDDLIGEPDILRREGDGYVAADIKSGAGEEGGEDEDGKPKRHYAVQLALYTDILQRMGHSAGRYAFVWDIHGEEVRYEFNSPQGPKTPQTLWQVYEDALQASRAILAETARTLPASASTCKLCHWYTRCRVEIEQLDDLTKIPGLGRANRDRLSVRISSVAEFAQIQPEAFIEKKKTVFPGIGPPSLLTFHQRAKLLVSPNARPYLKQPVSLPVRDEELFFDIEVDPLRDHTYLHGIVIRQNGAERFVSFATTEPSLDQERRAFEEAISFFRSRPTATIYVYSPYERTTYRKLQQRHPGICESTEIEALFNENRTVDLYKIVRTSTEWPTWDHSLKTLAKFLDFQWRDTNPSGASSIEWYHQFVQSRAPAMMQRILDYNEDDCRAMIVLLDGIRSLE